MRRVAFAVIALLMVIAPAPPADGVELNHAQQKRASGLYEQLRCMVCQNQSIADSSAALAQDLRREVREQIVVGRTDAEISAFMVERYGDFVLYRPPMKSTTLLLWFGPAALLLIGLLVLLAVLRSRDSRDALPALSEVERAKAARLLYAATQNRPGLPPDDESGKADR